MAVSAALRFAWRALSFTAGTLALGAALFTGWLLFVWPPPSWWRTHYPAATAFQRMRAGQYAISRDTFTFRYRPVPRDSISRWLREAAVAGEDDAFYQHGGIDWRMLREAIGYRRDRFDWRNPRDRADLMCAIGRSWEHPERLRGASTITQQLAKNLYLSPSRNPLRKVKEAIIAFRLEAALSKERILELYLNVAEFGPNLWGVEAASRHYFGRTAAELPLEQSALLVATLPHPLTSNPQLRPGRTRWRQQYILRRLRGEPVEMPLEGDDDRLPQPPPVELPDSMLPLPDSIKPAPAPPETLRINPPA